MHQIISPTHSKIKVTVSRQSAEMSFFVHPNHQEKMWINHFMNSLLNITVSRSQKIEFELTIKLVLDAQTIECVCRQWPVPPPISTVVVDYSDDQLVSYARKVTL